MEDEDFINLSDEDKIELIKNEKNEVRKLKIIRALSSDELMMQCVDFLLNESEKAAITYTLSKLENKIKIIDGLTEEKWITAATIELPSNKYKIKMLPKLKSAYYKNCIIQSLDYADKNIKVALDMIENENDLASAVSKTSDVMLKYNYLEKMKDEKNQSKVVISIGNEELTQEYIDKVTDKASKTLLTASLENREKRNELLEFDKNAYSNIEIPNGMTIGMEIECEGEGSIDAYIVDDILEGYHAKIDTSLQDGVEITTPILDNSRENTEDIYCVCKVLEDLGQNVSERCGGHIHIGADYLKTKEAYRNLIELWSNNEELIYLLSNKKGEIPRDGTIEYATPISKKIEKAVEDEKFSGYQYFSKEDMIEKIKDAQKNQGGREGRRTGINFLRDGSGDINTIEFRLANGTIDANTWIENATLFGNIIAVSQQISDIQQKDYITQDEQASLDKFELLKTKDISNEERLNIFFDLCVPETFRTIFMDRYLENSKILSENSETKEALEEHISDEPIDILKGLEDIAKQRRYGNVMVKEKELVSNYLEYENGTKEIGEQENLIE